MANAAGALTSPVHAAYPSLLRWAVNDADNCESFRKVRFHFLVHDGWFTKSWTVNHKDSFLVEKTMRDKWILKQVKWLFLK